MNALTFLLATEGVEGVSPDHIAADLALPIAFLIFGGAMFALLWSNYGAKKGALILGVGWFGFCGTIGVFWWFGAPGTPVATGLQNFPGQAADEYQPQWFPFQGESPRSEFFTLWQDIDNFQTLEEFAGTDDPTDPAFAALGGDLDGVSQLMLAQYLPRTEAGGLDIGASFRTMLQENTPAAAEGERLSGYVADIAMGDDGEPRLFLAEEDGIRVAAAELVTYAVFVDSGSGLETDRVEVDRTEWFAFKDPGAIWLPSAVWTILSFLFFGLCLALLDRIEQREKEEEVEAEEAMDVQVPIAQ